MSITDETLRLARQLRVDTGSITDNQTRDLVASWARAWDEVAGDLDAALQDLALAAGDGRITRAMLRQSQRLTNALSVIGGKLTDLADETGVRISGDLPEIVRLAGTAQFGIIASQLPPAGQDLPVSWSRVDADAIDAMVRRLTGRVVSTSRPLAPDAERAMKRELVGGLSAGRGPREVAARMVTRSEGAFNGGLTRALTISRTEMLDASRQAARLGQLANSDVLQGWVWSAELDQRTCMACWAMNDTEHPLAEDGPLGHPNCRCARLPVTLSWSDLGFDITEPASAAPSGSDLFDELDPADQVAILGRGRYDAWQAGDFPMSDWAQRRSNSDWRDSYVPAPVPA